MLMNMATGHLRQFVGALCTQMPLRFVYKNDNTVHIIGIRRHSARSALKLCTNDNNNFSANFSALYYASLLSYYGTHYCPASDCTD